MPAIIDPGRISGTIQAPPSKSMMQRVCAAALLHKGTTIIRNPGHADDDKAALDVILQLGAQVQFLEDGALSITGVDSIAGDTEIDCGESGLSARLFIPISAMADKPVKVNGNGSLLARPMDVYENILPQLGVQVKSNNGHLPFEITGPLQPKHIVVDGSVSSQFISGLLFAYAYSAKEAVTIEVTDLNSKPYIDLTLSVLEQFGKIIKHDNYQYFHIDPSKFISKQTVNITIEGDWSSAAYWLVAGAINGEVTVTGLDPFTVQADKAILQILQETGVRLSIAADYITAGSIGRLKPFDFDATDSPDLFPVLSILAACCNGESYITGVQRLIHKESNRAISISEMLSQFGVNHSVSGDILCVDGSEHLQAARIDSYNDHRIAMAAAVGTVNAYGRVSIHNADAVSKSYPGFFTDLQLLGISCSLNQ